MILTDTEQLCQRLQLAAMRSTSIILMVEYAGHVDTLSVTGYPAGTDFMKPVEDWPTRLLYTYVNLDADEAYGQLVAIIDELTNMGVEV